MLQENLENGKEKRKKQDTDMSDSFIVSHSFQNLSHSLCFIELTKISKHLKNTIQNTRGSSV